MRKHAAILAVGAALVAGCGSRSLFPPSTAVRVAQVESEKPDVRREALQALAKDGRARSASDVPKLYCLVARQDVDPLVRAAAVRGLAGMQGEGVVETLSHCALNDTSAYVRRDAVAALGGRVPPEGAAAIIGALQEDASVDVRIEAAETLRHFRDKAAAEALVGAVAYRDIAIARKGWESLRYMTGQDLPRDAQAWQEFLASADDPFAGYGKAPRMPKGQNQRPHFQKGLGDFFTDLFKKDPRQAELE